MLPDEHNLENAFDWLPAATLSCDVPYGPEHSFLESEELFLNAPPCLPSIRSHVLRAHYFLFPGLQWPCQRNVLLSSALGGIALAPTTGWCLAREETQSSSKMRDVEESLPRLGLVWPHCTRLFFQG